MRVYSEVSIFEEVALYPGKYPHWSVILNKHAEVCLNITQAELDAQLVEGELLFEYVKAAEGKEPIALKEYFDAVYADPEEMLVNSRAAFLLKHDKATAAGLSIAYGVVVQSEHALDDRVLVAPAMHRELPTNKVFDSKGKKGWHMLLDFDHPPSNAMVVIDPYLLTSPNGLANLTRLCDALLPTSLQVPFHVSIIASHITGSGANTVTRPETWRIPEAGKVMAAVKALRSYAIEVEVVFDKSTEYHKRRVVLNYANLVCDRGFAVFKEPRGNTVGEVNDVSFRRAFHDITAIGDTQYIVASSWLEGVKRKTGILAAHITNRTALDPGSIMGDCNTNKTLKNRLINDV